MAAPEIGGEFAGYRIEALIGRGGMGLVYRAEQIKLKRKVALKVLAPEVAPDETFRHRFIHESETAAGIDHPNIIPIYEADEVDDQLYIAMRYVDGLDLKEILQREGPLEPQRAIDLLGQVAGALDAAHQRGLVHRDVKPQNMLIHRGAGSEGGDLVYLTDFGLVKEVEAKQGMTAVGQFVGTIDYIAPEQMEGRRIDGRTDVYSLACVLYECLVGTVPYERDSEVSTMLAHMQDPPPPLSPRRPDLPHGLDGVIAKGMAKAPDDRFSTCREMIHAVRDEVESAARGERPAGGTVVAPGSAAGTVVAGIPPGGTVIGPSSGLGGGSQSPPGVSDPAAQAPGGWQPQSTSGPDHGAPAPSGGGYQPPGQSSGPGWQGGGQSGPGWGGQSGPGGPAPGWGGSGPHGPAPKKSKAPLFIALGIVALLVLGGGAFFLAGSGDDDEPKPDQSSAQPSPDSSDGGGDGTEAFPNAFEQNMLDHVPPDFQDTCQRLDFDIPPSATAAIMCTPDGADFVGYVQYERASIMNRDYNQAIKDNNVIKDSGSQFCRKFPPAEGAYTRGKKTIGRLMCYFDGSEAWMDWTSDQLLIYSFASRADGNMKKLFDVWVNAGPFGRRQ